MITITALRAFHYKFNNREVFFDPGETLTLDPNNPNDALEISFITRPDYAYRNFISIQDPNGYVTNCHSPYPMPSPSPYPNPYPTPYPNPFPNPNPGVYQCSNTCLLISNTSPPTPTIGSIYYDTNSETIKLYKDYTWKSITGTPSQNPNPNPSPNPNSQNIYASIIGDLKGGTNPNEVLIRTGIITNSHISDTASISLSKLAIDPLNRANHTGYQSVETLFDFDAQIANFTLDNFKPPLSALNLNNKRILNLGDPTNLTDGANKKYVDAKLNNIEFCNLIGPTCDLDFQGYRITDLGEPIQEHDAVNKEYVDNLNKYKSVKDSVYVLAEEHIENLSGLNHIIDDLEINIVTRVLVNGQKDERQNGIYITSEDAWIRTTDFNSNENLKPGSLVFISNGNKHKNSLWALKGTDSIILGISRIKFIKVSSESSFDFSSLLRFNSLTNQYELNLKDNHLLEYPEGIGISPLWRGNESISTVGIITKGNWSGCPIEIEYGGTGASNSAAARYNLSAAASGVNNDITSLQGLVNPLTILQGGTGANNLVDARRNLGVADCVNGVSSCITSLPNLQTPISIHQGGTSATDINSARFNLLAAKSGVNSDITSLIGLTTPIAISQGGTGANDSLEARLNLEVVGTGRNLGSGSRIFKEKTIGSDVTLDFRTITVDDTLNLVENSTDLFLSVDENNLDITNMSGILPISRGGTNATNSATALQNLGAVSNFNTPNGSGQSITLNKNGTVLEFKSIVGVGCTITTVGNTLVISVP